MSPQNFVPISTWSKSKLLSVLRNEDSVNLLTEVATQIDKYPNKLEELTDEDMSYSNLSISLAGKLGVTFGSVEGDFLRRIVIQEYSRYMDIFEGTGKVRWGISIRWICNVKKINVEAKLTSLPLISASAQLGYVQASSRFHVKGINSSIVTEKIPTVTELSTETYNVMNAAFKAIKDEIWKKKTNIVPTILGVYSDLKSGVDDSYKEALVIGRTLNRIKAGRTLKYALSHDPFKTPLSRETIKTVYMDVANISNENERPSDDARQKADDILGGRRII